jgi:hypothetical protein
VNEAAGHGGSPPHFVSEIDVHKLQQLSHFAVVARA